MVAPGPRVVHGLDGVRALTGETLGPTRDHGVTQERIDAFAEATDDRQWIHVDAARAASGPFGATIAHGFLTLSMASAWLDELLTVEGVSMAVNYGLDRVRFPAPVPVGSRLSLTATIVDVVDVAGGVQAKADLVWRRAGAERPVCVAAFVFRYYA